MAIEPPSSPLRRAPGFETPLATASPKQTKAMAMACWINAPAILKLPDGKWVAARTVETMKPKGFQVIFAEELEIGKAAFGRAAAIPVVALEDPDARRRVAQSIILGFLGGEFDAKGMKVRPFKISRSANGKSMVDYTFHATDGEQMGGTVQVSIDGFIEKFLADEQPPKPSVVDMASYPAVLEILRRAHILSERESKIEAVSVVIEFVCALAGADAKDEKLDFAATCAQAEKR